MPLGEGTRLGHYVVVRRLGAGGMGEVYLARDERLQREVALKLLPDGPLGHGTHRSPLLKEARLAARLDHPGICAVYEIGELDGRDYIAMQRVVGETLAARVARGPLSPELATDIAIQVAEALAYAHAQGVIHRDLKTQNVMVTPQDRAIVLDFGLARIDDQQSPSLSAATQTAAGIVSGTPSAMSPEQARGEVLDARTDVFSFGILLYELLSGREPFAGPSPADAIAAVLTREPPPLASVAPAAGPELQRIVHKCLEKDRTLRYGSMREVAIDLERLKRATVTTTGGAAAPPARRSRGAAMWIGAGVVVLAIVAAVLFVPRGGAGRSDAIRTLAVLPFRSLATGTQPNYLGLGIADAVISRISQDSGLVVRPTSAVRKYALTDLDAAQAAAQLKADAVLEGTWQQEGERLRVTANLLRARDGVSLWSEHFDASSSDIFQIQDQISDQLANRLRSRLGHAEEHGGTRNAEAYAAYTKGLFYFSDRAYDAEHRANSDQATRLFEAAVQLDPDYALAHAQLAHAYAWTATFIDVDSTLIAKAERELAVAERLDPRLGLVHLVRGLVLYSPYRGWRLLDAIREMKEAERLATNVPEADVGGLYLHLGVGWERRYEMALAQDPTDDRVRNEYVLGAYLLSLPELGRTLQKRLLGQEPDIRYWFGIGNIERCRADVEASAHQNPNDPNALIDLALLRAADKHSATADSIVRLYAPRLAKNRAYHHNTFEIAQVYAQCGDAREAVRWLDVTVQWGFPCYPLFERDWCLDPIRMSPEFTAFMSRLKPQWEQYVREVGE